MGGGGGGGKHFSKTFSIFYVLNSKNRGGGGEALQ